MFAHSLLLLGVTEEESYSNSEKKDLKDVDKAWVDEQIKGWMHG